MSMVISTDILKLRKEILNIPPELLSYILSFIPIIELSNMRYILRENNVDELFKSAALNKTYKFSSLHQFTDSLIEASKYGSIDTMSLVLPILPNINKMVNLTTRYDYEDIYYTIDKILMNCIMNDYIDSVLYIINIIKNINHFYSSNFIFSKLLIELFRYNKAIMLKRIMDEIYDYRIRYFKINCHSLINNICEDNDNYQVMEVFVDLLLEASSKIHTDEKYINYHDNDNIISDLFHVSLGYGRVNCAKVLLKHKHLINIKKYTGYSNIINEDIPDTRIFLETLYKRESTMMQAIFGNNMECIYIVLKLYRENNIDIMEEYEYNKCIEIASSHGNPKILKFIMSLSPEKFHNEENYNLILSNALSNINRNNILFIKELIKYHNIKININKIKSEAERILKYKKSITYYTTWGFNEEEDSVFDHTLFWERYFYLPHKCLGNMNVNTDKVFKELYKLICSL